MENIIKQKMKKKLIYYFVDKSIINTIKYQNPENDENLYFYEEEKKKRKEKVSSLPNHLTFSIS